MSRYNPNRTPEIVVFAAWMAVITMGVCWFLFLYREMMGLVAHRR